MKKSVIKISINKINATVSNGNNESSIEIDKCGNVHISSNTKKITIF